MRINKFFSAFLSLLMVCSIFGGLSVSATTKKLSLDYQGEFFAKKIKKFSKILDFFFISVVYIL